MKTPKISSIVIYESKTTPGTFVLVRRDTPNHDDYHIWCGQYGWLPKSDIAWTLQRVFHSMKKAERASDKYIKLPLQTLPVGQN